MKRVVSNLMVASVAVLTLIQIVPAHATVEITMVGTQFVPAVATVAYGETVRWTNAEPADYPAVIGKHNITPDPDTAGPLGYRAFPTSSKLIGLGAGWSCTGATTGAKCVGANNVTVTLTRGNYAYKCGLHPNHMRGILQIT